MIFAIADYLAYRFGRGRYSSQALENKGYRLATSENFGGSREAPPGLIFVLHGSVSAISWAIMYGTKIRG